MFATMANYRRKLKSAFKLKLAVSSFHDFNKACNNYY